MGTILITVDLEDWFQVENLRSHFPRSTWDSCKFRIEAPTHALLDLFDEFDVTATFFVLGWIAERLPHLVKEIMARGHEIASHGYNHELCSRLSSKNLHWDLYRSKILLEDITGQQVYGYRAPSFTMTRVLVNLLAEQAYYYDSSYNSFSLHDRYGSLEGSWEENPNGTLMSKEGIREIPISNLTLFGRSFPWGGGGYFRLYPFPIFRNGVAAILRRQGYYLFYCHPWEFDADQPRVGSLRPDLRFRHYVGIEKNLDKLVSFLSVFSDHSFTSCRAYVSNGF